MRGGGGDKNGLCGSPRGILFLAEQKQKQKGTADEGGGARVIKNGLCGLVRFKKTPPFLYRNAGGYLLIPPLPAGIPSHLPGIPATPSPSHEIPSR